MTLYKSELRQEVVRDFKKRSAKKHGRWEEREGERGRESIITTINPSKMKNKIINGNTIREYIIEKKVL